MSSLRAISNSGSNSFSGKESHAIEAGTKAKEVQFTHLPRIN